MATAQGIGVSRDGHSIAPVTPSGVCSPSGIKVVCNAVGRTLGMVGLSISDLKHEAVGKDRQKTIRRTRTGPD